MPQITQLPMIFWSQLFWVAILFGFVFFVIGRMMLPKIQGTVDLRDSKIAEDLERAQAARAKADETEAAWRARMDAARSEAARVSQEAKQESAREAEARVKGAADKVNVKVEKAEQQIRDALVSARAEIESVAAEATQEMVRRLTGIVVDSNEAAQAVKAEMNG